MCFERARIPRLTARSSGNDPSMILRVLKSTSRSGRFGRRFDWVADTQSKDVSCGILVRFWYARKWPCSNFLGFQVPPARFERATPGLGNTGTPDASTFSDKPLGSPPLPVCTTGCTSPDLARVIDAWATLPDPLRRAILALVGTAERPQG